MQGSTKVGALVPAVKRAGQTLALLGVLALFGLVGAGMSHVHAALTLNGVRIAASNGDILIGTTDAATNGVRIAATTGDIHIGNGG